MSRQDTLVSAREVARILGLSPRTVHRYAAEGRIPCFQLAPGHRRSFDLAAVERALTGAPPPKACPSDPAVEGHHPPRIGPEAW